VDGEPLTVTMRTPGDDIDLAAGFLFTEGLLTGLGDVHEIRMCDENAAAVTVADDAGLLKAHGVDGFRAAARNFLTTSVCGVCAKDSIEAIRVRSAFDVAADPVRVSPAVLAGLPDQLREAQRSYRTGGLHAAGLFTPGRHAAGAAGGRGPSQRGGQGGRLGPALRSGPAGRARLAGQREGLLRARAESAHDRASGAGGGVRAVLAGGVAGRRGRHDQGCGGRAGRDGRARISACLYVQASSAL
jgi:hypothetical protein